MESIETYYYRGYSIGIYQDIDPLNPREFDSLGTMACFHTGYSLGDEETPDYYSDWLADMADSIEDLPATIEDMVVNGAPVQELGKVLLPLIRKHFFILPLFLYDHSGLWMSTSNRSWPFNCPWDSGQVGWIYVSRKRVREQYGIKRISKKLQDKVLDRLVGEVRTYSQYLSGDIYGYIVWDDDGEEVDSCWGYYGSDIHSNGLMWTAKAAIDADIEDRIKKHIKKVKAWIRGHVPFTYRAPLVSGGLNNKIWRLI